MTPVEYPSLIERVYAPVISEGVDYDALDGSIRAYYPLTRVVSTATIYGACVWGEHLYYVAGDRFYRYPNILLGVLDSEPLVTERVYFVPLADTLVIVASSQIYIYDASGFRRWERPAKPTSAPSTERIFYTFQRGSDQGGSAVFSEDATSYTLDDVADGEPGAHRWFGLQLTPDRPTWVSEIVLRLISWQNTISTREHAGIELHEDTTGEKLIAKTVLPYPYTIGEHSLQPLEPIRLSDTLRLRHFVRHSQRWGRTYYARAVSSPRKYALTRVVNGIESEPLYFDVGTAGVGVNDRYWVRLTGLPATGTWRLYRADAAGVYRLVAERTNTATYTDWLSDDELGNALDVQAYPTQAQLAVLHNRRAVLVDGNRVYVSEAARWAFGAGSEVITLHDSVIGVASVRGILYVATRQGWYALMQGEVVYVANTLLPPPVAGYVSERYLATGDGITDGGQPLYRELMTPVMDAVQVGAHRYLIDATGRVLIQFGNGKLTALEGSYRGLVVHQGELYVYGLDGWYKFAPTRGSARLKWRLRLDSPANVYYLRVRGQGNATLRITTRAGVRTVSGALPLRDVPRVEHDNYEVELELLWSGNTVLEPLLLETEPRLQRTR